jgi:hypothetical protein
VNAVSAVVAEVSRLALTQPGSFSGSLNLLQCPLQTSPHDANRKSRRIRPFVEHHPRSFTRSDQTGPARAIVVVELL